MPLQTAQGRIGNHNALATAYRGPLVRIVIAQQCPGTLARIVVGDGHPEVINFDAKRCRDPTAATYDPRLLMARRIRERNSETEC